MDDICSLEDDHWSRTNADGKLSLLSRILVRALTLAGNNVVLLVQVEPNYSTRVLSIPLDELLK